MKRRDFLITSLTGLTGIALLSDTGSSRGTASAANAPRYPWGYKKLSPEKVAARAYENFFRGYCCYAVSSAILLSLQEEVGEPYTMLPVDAFKFGHGGIIGWGTICGTLLGAGIATSFAAGREGEEILNDVLNWYADTELPVYVPGSPRASIKNKNRSNSPLCHVSVNRWMAKEGVPFKSAQRKERCARLAADVAQNTVILLNRWSDGKFEMKHDSQIALYNTTTQHNCTECHGSEVPMPPRK